MSRLPRPHIPLAVRVKVAERQLAEASKEYHRFLKYMPLGARLRALLQVLFGDKKTELHHRPALVNRQRRRNGEYDPPANDPDFLVYLAEDDHDIETRVRGQHGQHSDLGLRRKAKAIARNRDPRRRKAKIKSRGFQKGPKRKIQSRGFR